MEISPPLANFSVLRKFFRKARNQCYKICGFALQSLHGINYRGTKINSSCNLMTPDEIWQTTYNNLIKYMNEYKKDLQVLLNI